MRIPIVFYDGECGFCNRSVQFILDREKSAGLYFSALQSDFAVQFFKAHKLPPPDLSTFYFFDGNTMYSRSGGALRVCRFLRFPWNLLPVFLVVPRFVRDGVYDFIAKRRTAFGNAHCVLPTSEQRKRFIRNVSAGEQ